MLYVLAEKSKLSKPQIKETQSLVHIGDGAHRLSYGIFANKEMLVIQLV
jgi:hypothetical protein